MALLTINETVLESLARYKRSSLFGFFISDEEKRFINIDNRSRHLQVPMS
jgi:hypothetical protein